MKYFSYLCRKINRYKNMERGYRYRIYPTPEQEVLMSKTFGCVRFVYNWGLELKSRLWKEEQKNIGRFELQGLMQKELKTKHEWLKEVNSQSLQFAVKQLSDAYNLFFKGTGRYPIFKSKYGRQKFNCPQHCRVDFKHGRLEMPKFIGKNSIKCVFHRRFKGRIGRVTITRECDGKYYATILVNDNINALPKKPVLEETTIGIDTGLKSFAVLSTGETIDSPTFSKNEKKHLATLQHSLCRKVKGSSNYRKTKLRVARLHSKIANRRSDFLHKLTHRLTRKSQAGTICVEDLNVKGMIKNHHLAYSIEDAGLGEFYLLLSYKCEWYGVNYRVIGRFEPSSKMCHVCGYRRPTLSLSIRQWTCPSCGTKLDRDLNAAINIKHLGLGETLPTERGEVKPVEKPTMDDRPVRQDLKSSAPVKQEKYRGKSLCRHEATESLAQG